MVPPPLLSTLPLTMGSVVREVQAAFFRSFYRDREKIQSYLPLNKLNIAHLRTCQRGQMQIWARGKGLPCAPLAKLARLRRRIGQRVL